LVLANSRRHADTPRRKAVRLPAVRLRIGQSTG
jgi:hypothetical protein